MLLTVVLGLDRAEGGSQTLSAIPLSAVTDSDPLFGG